MTEDLDAIAGRYYEAPPADEWIEDRVVRWIMPKIIGWCSGRVLEMGYGAGRTTEMLLAAGVDLTVVEGSMELVGVAMERHPEAQVVASHFEDFSAGSIKYDTVLCLHVLEHVDDPVALLRRVHGWLRPGGRLIAVTPNADSWHRQLGQVMTGEPLDTLSDRDRLVGHVRVFDYATLNSAVEQAGFDLRQNFGWFHKALPNSMLVSCPPEVIDGLCQLGWDSDDDAPANIGVVARRA